MPERSIRFRKPSSSANPVVDVVGVGLNATDTLLEISHFPAPGGKVEVIACHILPGGQVASALQACASWGLRARYCGKTGDDDAGMLQRRELRRARAEAHWAIARGCESQRSWILVDRSTGERTVLWSRDKHLELRPVELRREWVTRSKILLVDGHDTTAAIQAAKWARAAGIRVVADIDNIYPEVEALLEHTDYLVGSREFPGRITGLDNFLEGLPIIARRFGCKLVGATLGKEGALVWTGESFHYAPAYIVNAVDTTGAGDVFHGAMVYSLLKNWPIPQMLDFCCAAAALNCTALGARGGIRPVAEIVRFAAIGKRHNSLYPTREFSNLTRAT